MKKNKFMYVIALIDEKENHFANMFIFNFPSRSVIILEGCYNYNLLARQEQLQKFIQDVDVQNKYHIVQPFVILELSNIYGLKKDFLFPLYEKDYFIPDENYFNILEAIFRYQKIREKKFDYFKKLYEK